LRLVFETTLKYHNVTPYKPKFLASWASDKTGNQRRRRFLSLGIGFISRQTLVGRRSKDEVKFFLEQLDELFPVFWESDHQVVGCDATTKWNHRSLFKVLHHALQIKRLG
jgi:hypothetical protein